MRLNSQQKDSLNFNLDRGLICKNYNARLVSVNNYNENKFIIDWLQNNDPHKRTWLTSGLKDSINNWRWSGDQSNLNNIVDLWLPKEAQSNVTLTSSSLKACYKYHAPSGRWGLSQVLMADIVTGIVCEALKNKLFISTDKYIDYGQDVYDKSKVERGPKIVNEPDDVIFDISGRSQSNQVKLRCVADAYPEPEYKWFKYEPSSDSSDSRREIDVLSDNRFTLTDGTLIIWNPSAETDRAQYQCQATNRYGIVISKKITLQFGYITEFTKKRSPERGQENWGKALSCDAPSRRPSTLNYYWSRSEFPNFVTEGPRIFISRDGNLYFSSLEKIDRANYSCNVQSVISSTGRTGPSFPLYVDSGSSGQKLQFANDFPKVFPEGPLAGQEVRLECMAYGYPTPSYNWTRTGTTNRLPDQFRILNDGKVLSLPKIKIEDDGEYICTAILDSYSIQKSVYISVQATPQFTQPIEDQILYPGETMTLTCEAFGLPAVTYTWYKDGQDMSQIIDSRYIINNSVDKISILSINGISVHDAGMYQCAAINQHGSAFSTAQVKVGEFRLNFNKYALPKSTHAMVGQEITLACAPEGLPQAHKIEWYKSGQPLFSRDMSYYSRNIEKLKNNFLHIKNLTLEDDGWYHCVASQVGALGNTVESKTDTWLVVLPKPMETDRRLLMRDFARYGDPFKVLSCDVQIRGGTTQELSHVWYKNGIKINFESNSEKYSKSESGSLVLHNITYVDEANYTCQAKTSVGSVEFSGRLIVEGPPDPCGQVIAEIQTGNRARISWTDGYNHGSRITSHNIEARTNYNSTWTVIASRVFEAPILKSSSSVRLQYYRRYFVISDLLPNTQYTFRVSSANEHGLGEPSAPSPQYRTEASEPRYAVTNLSGGGGKAGTLVIRWDPLPRALWGDDEIWYMVHYKRNESQDYERQELKAAGNRSAYTISVGTDNSYKLYNLAVFPVNRMGVGPPNRANIYSAQMMPNIQPSSVYAVAFNSTSLNVTWSPIVEDIPENNDRVVGYRIKYWPSKRNPQTDSLTTLKRGLKTWGLLVGLMPDTEYQLVVMAYNDAGSGPQSESFRIKTYKSAPLRPPTSVEVSPSVSDSVIVRWRGVSTVSTDEEPILGYKVRYWRTNENISKAKVIDIKLGGKELTATIDDLIRGEEYKLRVLAYSAGGDGKMSSPEKTIKV